MRGRVEGNHRVGRLYSRGDLIPKAILPDIEIGETTAREPDDGGRELLHQGGRFGRKIIEPGIPHAVAGGYDIVAEEQGIGANGGQINLDGNYRLHIV